MARRARSLDEAFPTRKLAAPASASRGTDPQQAEADRLRSTARWQALRLLVLSREPMCRPCRQAGVEIVATEVDHVVPAVEMIRRHGAVGVFVEANLQPICRPCHAAKSARERM